MSRTERTAGYGKQQKDAYNDHDGHQVTNTIKRDWDLSGATQEMQLPLRVGYSVANGERYPRWNPGAEFRAKRDAMLALLAENK